MNNKQIMSLLIVSLACVMPMQAMLGKATRFSTIKNMRNIHQDRQLSDQQAVRYGLEHGSKGAWLGALVLGGSTYCAGHGAKALKLSGDKDASPATSNSAISASALVSGIGGFIGCGFVRSYQVAGVRGCAAYTGYFAVMAGATTVAVAAAAAGANAAHNKTSKS